MWPDTAASHWGGLLPIEPVPSLARLTGAFNAISAARLIRQDEPRRHELQTRVALSIWCRMSNAVQPYSITLSARASSIGGI
jgi:hypothetical protein